MKTTRWSKLLSLSLVEVWFLVRATAVVVGFDLAFRLFSPKTYLAFFERKAASHRRHKGMDPQRMAWLINVADRYAPGRSSCLRRATALAWLLGRRGVATSLRIGVAWEEGNLVAHSWLESGDGELFGLTEREKYAPLSSPTLSDPLRTGSEK